MMRLSFLVCAICDGLAFGWVVFLEVVLGTWVEYTYRIIAWDGG